MQSPPFLLFLKDAEEDPEPKDIALQTPSLLEAMEGRAGTAHLTPHSED